LRRWSARSVLNRSSHRLPWSFPLLAWDSGVVQLSMLSRLL
jgi:hypothetical protein